MPRTERLDPTPTIIFGEEIVPWLLHYLAKIIQPCEKRIVVAGLAEIPTRRGRKPKRDRSKVANKKVDFAVTAKEKARLQKWAREDGCAKLSVWLREQIGLPSKPPQEDE